MNPLLAELLAERFPTPNQVEWEKRSTPAWVECESDLIKYRRRRALLAAIDGPADEEGRAAA